ncbi:hypothetical protein BH10PSE16_BH10PSE16_01290 [soil metagenome]
MEATSKQEISEADRALACLAGLVMAMPGTGTQDAAMAKFAAAIRAPLLDKITVCEAMLTRATATIAALHDAPPIGKKLTLTGLQISYLHDACGGEMETELSISRFEDGGTCADTGDCMPAGLYCWYDDYPEEGRIYLPEDADAALALQAPPAAPVVERLPADDTEGGEA